MVCLNQGTLEGAPLSLSMTGPAVINRLHGKELFSRPRAPCTISGNINKLLARLKLKLVPLINLLITRLVNKGQLTEMEGIGIDRLNKLVLLMEP